jgi:hypothetical protein
MNCGVGPSGVETVGPYEANPSNLPSLLCASSHAWMVAPYPVSPFEGAVLVVVGGGAEVVVVGGSVVVGGGSVVGVVAGAEVVVVGGTV